MACDFLVTGCRGQLGRDLMTLFATEHSVRGIDIQDCDITVAPDIHRAITEIRPRVVLHTAAFTDVDGCESDSENAMRVNAEGAGNVAVACRSVGALMVYYSTDYVFDGNKDRPYTESDRTDPQTVYGQSKLQGERAVRAALDEYIILRIAWVYGRHGRNFVKTIIGLGKKQIETVASGGELPDSLKVVDDQVGNPCWTMEIARQTQAVVLSGLRGLFHATSEGETTWYGLARVVFETLGLDVNIVPCTSDEYVRPATRPKCSTLENDRLKTAGLNVMRPWREALESFLHENGRELLSEG